MTIDEELLNRDISDISSSSNMADAVGTSTPTDLSKDVATSSKTLSNSSKSNVSKLFGVYDTKQVVREISSRPPQDTNEVQSYSSDLIESLKQKTGMSVGTDIELEQATEVVLQNILQAQQTSYDSLVGNSPFSLGNVVSDGSMIPEYLKVKPSTSWLSIGNITEDLDVRSLIPSFMSTDDYGFLQKSFSANSLGRFNTCPNLASALNYIKKLLNPKDLLNMLYGLFGIVGKFDLQGFLNCIAKAQREITAVQRADLTKTLVDRGAINALTDLTKVTSGKGSIADKYNTIRRVGQRRSINTNSITGRTTNTWKNPDVRTSSDIFIQQMGINPDLVMAASSSSTARNPNITSRISSTIIDNKALRQIPKEVGFGEYLLGSTDQLLRSIPI